MKKKIALVILLIVGLILLSSCGNRQHGIDPNQTFTKAYILLNGEWQEIKVKAWRDYDNSDVVQFISTDGRVYLTHYMNVVLMDK